MRTLLVPLVALLLLQAVFVKEAHGQQLITTCGASTGKSYYLEPEKHGWVDDKISDGTTTFFRYPNGDYDVLYKDTVGAHSARLDGATVVKVHDEGDNLLTFVVIYQLHVTEVYQLTLDGTGHGTLIWSNIKNRAGPAGITRGMLLTSNCSR
jgi:hypothetical protein